MVRDRLVRGFLTSGRTTVGCWHGSKTWNVKWNWIISPKSILWAKWPTELCDIVQVYSVESREPSAESITAIGFEESQMLASLVSGTLCLGNLPRAVGACVSLPWSSDLSPEGHFTGCEWQAVWQVLLRSTQPLLCVVWARGVDDLRLLPEGGAPSCISYNVAVYTYPGNTFKLRALSLWVEASLWGLFRTQVGFMATVGDFEVKYSQHSSSVEALDCIEIPLLFWSFLGWTILRGLGDKGL